MGLGMFLRFSVAMEVLEDIGPIITAAMTSTITQLEALLGPKYDEWATTLPTNMWVTLPGTEVTFDLKATAQWWANLPWSTLKDIASTFLGIPIFTWASNLTKLIKIPTTQYLYFKSGETVQRGIDYSPVKKLSLFDILKLRFAWDVTKACIKVVRNTLGGEGCKTFTATLLGMGSSFITRRSIGYLTQTMVSQIHGYDMDDEIELIKADIAALSTKVEALTYKPYG